MWDWDSWGLYKTLLQLRCKLQYNVLSLAGEPSTCIYIYPDFQNSCVFLKFPRRRRCLRPSLRYFHSNSPRLCSLQGDAYTLASYLPPKILTKPASGVRAIALGASELLVWVVFTALDLAVCSVLCIYQPPPPPPFSKQVLVLNVLSGLRVGSSDIVIVVWKFFLYHYHEFFCSIH